MSRIEEIKARLAAATPGTWVALPPEGDSGFLVYSRDGGGPLAATTKVQDAIFIANAPADLAWAIERIEEYAAALEEAIWFLPGFLVDGSPESNARLEHMWECIEKAKKGLGDTNEATPKA